MKKVNIDLDHFCAYSGINGDEKLELLSIVEAIKVSFGNYLLSDKRQSELKEVSHADLSNWNEEID